VFGKVGLLKGGLDESFMSLYAFLFVLASFEKTAIDYS